MEEKRECQRFKLLNHPLIYDAHSNNFLGRMVDVTAGGFRLQTKEKMTPDENYYFKIVSQSDTNDKKEIIAEMNVRWCNRNPDTNDYTVGCSVAENKTDIRVQLCELIIQELKD